MLRRVLCLLGCHRPARGTVTRKIKGNATIYHGTCRRCGHAIYRDPVRLKWVVEA